MAKVKSTVSGPQADGYKSSLPVKTTSPMVKKMSIGEYKPSRPQNKQPQGVGGRITPMARKAKNRRAMAESDPKDPGSYPLASAKVNWPTQDQKAKKGYVTGKSWPKANKTTAVHEDAAAVTAPHE